MRGWVVWTFAIRPWEPCSNRKIDSYVQKRWLLDINDGLEAVDWYVIAKRQFSVSEVWSYWPSLNCWSPQMKHSFPASSVQYRCHTNHHEMNLSKCLPHVLYGCPSWYISITSIRTYRGYSYLSRSPIFFNWVYFVRQIAHWKK